MVNLSWFFVCEILSSAWANFQYFCLYCKHEAKEDGPFVPILMWIHLVFQTYMYYVSMTITNSCQSIICKPAERTKEKPQNCELENNLLQLWALRLVKKKATRKCISRSRRILCTWGSGSGSLICTLYTKHSTPYIIHYTLCTKHYTI